MLLPIFDQLRCPSLPLMEILKLLRLLVYVFVCSIRKTRIFMREKYLLFLVFKGTLIELVGSSLCVPELRNSSHYRGYGLLLKETTWLGRELAAPDLPASCASKIFFSFFPFSLALIGVGEASHAGTRVQYSTPIRCSDGKSGPDPSMQFWTNASFLKRTDARLLHTSYKPTTQWWGKEKKRSVLTQFVPNSHIGLFSSNPIAFMIHICFLNFMLWW